MSATTSNYGPTAARTHGRPGREIRPSSITVDMHSHLLVPEAAAIAEPHLDPMTVSPHRFSTPETRSVNADQNRDRLRHITDLETRLAEMAAMGLDRQLIAPAPPQSYYTIEAGIARRTTRIVNEGIAAFVARRPDLFAGLGTVPMQDPPAVASELTHAVETLGLKGVQLLTSLPGRELSDPAYEPFWTRAEELGAVVMLHPNGYPEGERLKRFYFSNVIGNPLDTAVAVHYLIFDGVLARHPGLKIIAVHGGGYLGGYSGRIDHAWGARPDCRGDLKEPPGTYLRRMYVDTIVFTPHQLSALVAVFGPDHVMLGTDYPFDMGEYDAVGHVLETPGLDATTQAKIVGGNAARLFGMT
ncbi:MAG TPA: amidohydrolase family protein [Acetobacteraceae bacterium]|nr:amidohydrolase family protein [Acetobacteraceae bacterium]